MTKVQVYAWFIPANLGDYPTDCVTATRREVPVAARSSSTCGRNLEYCHGGSKTWWVTKTTSFPGTIRRLSPPETTEDAGRGCETHHWASSAGSDAGREDVRCSTWDRPWRRLRGGLAGSMVCNPCHRADLGLVSQ